MSLILYVGVFGLDVSYWSESCSQMKQYVAVESSQETDFSFVGIKSRSIFNADKFIPFTRTYRDKRRIDVSRVEGPRGPVYVLRGDDSSYATYKYGGRKFRAVSKCFTPFQIPKFGNLEIWTGKVLRLKRPSSMFFASHTLVCGNQFNKDASVFIVSECLINGQTCEHSQHGMYV